MLAGMRESIIDFEYSAMPTIVAVFVRAPCPSELIYGEYSEEAELLRYVLDNFLSQTFEGRELIRLYYRWSPAMAKAMGKDEEFKPELKEIIDGVLELMGGEAN